MAYGSEESSRLELLPYATVSRFVGLIARNRHFNYGTFGDYECYDGGNGEGDLGGEITKNNNYNK